MQKYFYSHNRSDAENGHSEIPCAIHVPQPDTGGITSMISSSSLFAVVFTLYILTYVMIKMTICLTVTTKWALEVMILGHLLICAEFNHCPAIPYPSSSQTVVHGVHPKNKTLGAMMVPATWCLLKNS